MKQEILKIENIPAILWGEKTGNLFIAVHGLMSNKADVVITVFAEEAVARGYQVLSFDLPEHGDRKSEPLLCKVQTCVQELKTILQYSQSLASNINIFACSMGAYFSLLAYKDSDIQKSLFLSPVVDMERIIGNMMRWFYVSEAQLKDKGEIPIPNNQPLYWDYYCYVKEHPIEKWNAPSAMLYGSDDTICEYDVVIKFVEKFHCDLQILEHGEHFFHTSEQLDCFRYWVKKHINI